MRKISVVLTTIVAAVSAPAMAATMVEPDTFAAGTDISNAFAGVTLATVRTGTSINDIQSISAVFSVTDANATTGTRSFGQTSTNSTWGNGSFEYLLATFDSPVFSVSLDFFANDANDANAQLLAFDELGNSIYTVSASSVTLGTPATLTVSGGGIKFIRAYWDEINRSENGGLDNLSFTSASVAAVPEPGTWAMMLLGFGFVGGAMRSAKRRQKVTVSYA